MKTLILSVFCLVLLSCQRSDKKIITAEFSINKSLLAENPFVSKGFSINPPKNWSKTERFNSELQNKILYRTDNKLLAIYKSDSTNCVLIISELPESNFDIIKGKLDSYSRHDSIWTDVQSSVFMYKRYEIIQVVFQNTELIIFKLFTRWQSELYELEG